MPIEEKKLSQGTQVPAVDIGHCIPLFVPGVSNDFIKFVNLITQIRNAIDAYTRAETDVLLDAKANDADVVHKAGFEAITGEKDFQTFPLLPTIDPTQDFQAVHKKYVDMLYAFLADLFNQLSDLVNKKWHVPVKIDCGVNPGYPAALLGATYLVEDLGNGGNGRVGGATGPKVEIGDMILCLETTAGGSHTSVGNLFTIIQGNIDKATDTVAGTIKLSTNSSVIAGIANDEAVTPTTLWHFTNQLLLKKSAPKTLRFTIGNGPGEFPAGSAIVSPQLENAKIFGMMFIDMVPYDNVESGITVDMTFGILDLTSIGGLQNGQKVLMTIITQ